MRAYLDNSRSYLLPQVQTLRFGGFKFAALESAVRVLRDHDIDVYLVQTPTSRWLRERLDQTEGGRRFLEEMPELAKRERGQFCSTIGLKTAFDQNRYSDDMHVYFGPEGMDYFTALLAQRLTGQGFTRRPPSTVPAR